jgi:prepilin-type N-terminal cleavage/methylation domain-containing protein
MRSTMRVTRVRSSCSFSGFTLVELLVVIGIISVLISVLLPALARARESANRVVCMSNFRQVGIAVVMYVNENKGYTPPGSTPSYENPSTALMFNGYGWVPRLNRYIKSTIPSYLERKGAFFCPMDNLTPVGPDFWFLQIPAMSSYKVIPEFFWQSKGTNFVWEGVSSGSSDFFSYPIRLGKPGRSQGAWQLGGWARGASMPIMAEQIGPGINDQWGGFVSTFNDKFKDRVDSSTPGVNRLTTSPHRSKTETTRSVLYSDGHVEHGVVRWDNANQLFMHPGNQ